MSFARTTLLALGALGAMSLVACSKSSTAESAAGDAGHAMTAPSGSAATAPSSVASTNPGPDEYPPSEKKADRKATKEISAANYKTELTKMDKEIGNP